MHINVSPKNETQRMTVDQQNSLIDIKYCRQIVTDWRYQSTYMYYDIKHLLSTIFQWACSDACNFKISFFYYAPRSKIRGQICVLFSSRLSFCHSVNISETWNLLITLERWEIELGFFKEHSYWQHLSVATNIFYHVTLTLKFDLHVFITKL